MRRSGFTLIEVLMAAVVVATVLIGMALFQTATLKVHSKEKDRAFAMQKAVQMMEEILAFQVTAGTAAESNVDTLAQADTDYSYLLTIDPKVTDAGSALSGNQRQGVNYRFVRQIHVEPLPNDKGARRVSVAVYYAQPGTTAQPSATTPLAYVSNIVKAAAAASQATQVYDMYIMDIENMPGWWCDPSTFRPILASTFDLLKANNPGLEIRTHWIRRLAYGRDPYYKPYLNSANPANNSAMVPMNSVYFYPGKLDATSIKYNQAMMGGQLKVDTIDKNPMLPLAASVNNYPENQLAYTFSDEYNHAVRYPEEVAKYNAICKTMIAAHKAPPEPSLRMVLEQMASGQLKNVILVNMPCELIPVVSMRNYSDPARLPDDPDPNFSNLWGVSSGSSSGGSHIRLVTHPRYLQRPKFNGTSSSKIDLRVYPFKDKFGNLSNDSDLTAAQRSARLVIRNAKDSIHRWNGGHEEDSVVIEVLEPVTSGYDGFGRGHSGTIYKWNTIWPMNQDDAVGSYLDGSNPVEIIDHTDAAKDLYKDDLVIRLKNVPYTHPVVAGQYRYPSGFLGLGTSQKGYSQGLSTNQNLYGFNYLPDPLVDDLENDWDDPAVNQPRNTARFRITFWSDDDRRFDVLTTIGNDDNLQHHQAPNRSVTYQYVGSEPVPYSEQFQFVGDPRMMPYKDVRDNHGYNRYFEDFSNNNAYKNGGSNAYNNFAKSDVYDGGKPISVDIPRYFEFMRKGLLGSNSMYANPAGFSFYYFGLGGELYGQPAATVSGKPYNGSNALITPDDVIDTQYGIERTDGQWSAVPSIGELYPDDQWASWRTDGNLPTSTFRREDYADMQPWKPSGSNTSKAKRLGAFGSRTFFNGGSSPNTFFSHLFRDPHMNQIVSPGAGQEVAQSFSLYLDSTFASYRPFIIDETSGAPPDWTASAGSRTTLSWGLTAAPNCYYRQDNTADEKAVAPIVIRENGSGNKAYACMNASAYTNEAGTTSIARLSIAASLQSLFDLAAVTTSDSEAIKLIPRLQVVAPVDDTQLTNNQDDIEWNIDWMRWNMNAYSQQHGVPYKNNVNKPSLVYNIKYSTNAGASWFFLNDRNTEAYAGIYDPSHAVNVTNTSSGAKWRWNYNNWPNREYVIRVEAYRAGTGYAGAPVADIGYTGAHYAYHQLTCTIAH